MQALEAGAVDVILKPRLDTEQFLQRIADAHLRRRSRRPRGARLRRQRAPRVGRTPSRRS